MSRVLRQPLRPGVEWELDNVTVSPASSPAAW